MKTILTSIFFTITILASFAQNTMNTEEHMKFKGVPIDGNLDEYIASMENNAFFLVKKEDNIAILQGDFATYKDCEIVISTLKNKDLVSRISVKFPKCENWEHLSSNYYYINELLTEKYGKPAYTSEEFDGLYQPTDDNAKMSYLSQNKCKFFTKYKLDSGMIQISIEKSGYDKGYVLLSYFDKVNGEVIRKTAIDDL